MVFMKKIFFVIISLLIHQSLVFGMAHPPVGKLVSNSGEATHSRVRFDEFLRTPVDELEYFKDAHEEGASADVVASVLEGDQQAGAGKKTVATSSNLREVVPECFDRLELQIRDGVFLIKFVPISETRGIRGDIKKELDQLSEKPQYVLVRPDRSFDGYILTYKDSSALKSENRRQLKQQMRSDLKALASIAGVVIHCDLLDPYEY